MQIIVHAAAGADWQLLVGFTLRLAVHIRNRAHAEAFRLLTLLFSVSWPETMPPDYRIVFRAVQVRLLMLLGEDETEVAQDLEHLISEAQRDASMSVLTALLLTGPMNPAARPGLQARRALQARRVLAGSPDAIRGLSDDVPFESLIWLSVTRLRDLNDVRDLLGVLRDMSPQERTASFSYEPLVDAPQLFVDQCWMLELRKSEHDRDWEIVLGVLDAIREIGEMPGGASLLAPAARARAIALADGLARYEEAMDVIDRRLENADTNGRFLLNYTAGCVLLDHSTPARALERFRLALTTGATAHGFLRVDAGRLAAEAAARNGEWSAAIKEVKASLQTVKAERIENILRYERLELIGELAWAHWLAGSPKKACAAMSAVVRPLVRTPETSQARYREVFLKAGHVLGWMAAVAKHSEPPPHGADGSPYTEPFPGILSRPRPGVATAPIRPLAHVLLTQLGLLAAGVGLPGLARKTLLAARVSAESTGLSAFSRLIDLQLAEVAVAAGDYAEAVHRGISGVRTIAVSRQAGPRPDVLGGTFSLDTLWAELGETERRDIEHGLFWSVVAPAMTGTLADAGPAQIGPLTDTLDQIFRDSAGQLSDIEYWRGILREARIAFSPLATRAIVRNQIQEHPGGLLMSVLLHLALGETPDSTLQDSCGAHVVAFEALLHTRPVSEAMVRNVARHILEFWRRVAERQAFALRRPVAFRTALAPLVEDSSSSAIQVLLHAAAATGVVLGDELLRSLMAGGRRSP